MIEEPIAIIGIGCRFPRAHGPDAFWNLLRDGADAITTIPPDRWNAEDHYHPDPGITDKMNTRKGAFLTDIDQFDGHFFGMAATEVECMDPQHRLLLETTWETLEDAGYVPAHLAGKNVGVFLGISSGDYGYLFWDQPIKTPFGNTGNSRAIASNRLSYFFDFSGLSISIDTACSSSLVAVHMACQSLRTKESQLALAGGVNLILSPRIMSGLAQAGFLSPEGRCHAFDARADGYVRGEGVGMVLLKPFEQAKTDGDAIYAVIRGSALNQDGRSNGLTAPNSLAQENMLHQAYHNAGVNPGSVQYIEAHGTGTLLGDPIEIKALGKVLSEGRSNESKCWVGSVKTNIGHLEAAAGIASLIKVALCIKHCSIVPNLHFSEPNQFIPFQRLPLQIPQTLEPWPQSEGPCLAGVSSFGFGGTNVHMVLQDARLEIPPPSLTQGSRHLFTLRAKTDQALKDMVLEYHDFLMMNPGLSLADLCVTANTCRSDFPHRLAIVTDSVNQLQEQLHTFSQGTEPFLSKKGVLSKRNPPQVAFLFTGQGAQYIGMGAQLYQTQPVFRDTLQYCQELLRPYLPYPLLSVLYPQSEASSPLRETAYAQPALFALEYALAQVWKSWGIEPHMVMGHSVGEYVAACLAEVFRLEDGLKLIAERGRLMQQISEEGEMLAVFAGESDIHSYLRQWENDISLAAINGPKNHVISGQKTAIHAIEETLQAKGIEVKRLHVSHAFHSPLMEPILDSFDQVCQTVSFSPPTIPLISNVTGKPMTQEMCDPQYWVRHIRAPVNFAAGIKSLEQGGCNVYVEVGPRPILIGLGRHCLTNEDHPLLCPSLHPDQPDWERMLLSLGELYIRGLEVNWKGLNPNTPHRRLHLPLYPFQRERYWFSRVEKIQKASSTVTEPNGSHVSIQGLHGHRLPPQAPSPYKHIWQLEINKEQLPYLQDHAIWNVPYVPGGVYLEMVLAAATEFWGNQFFRLESVEYKQPLFLPDGRIPTVQIVLTETSNTQLEFHLYSRSEPIQKDWNLHVLGTIIQNDS